MSESEFRLGVSFLAGLVMLWPLWRIFTRTGKSPMLAFLVFIPILGWLAIYLILALSKWPALPSDNKGAG
jgi:hypothetical protein